MGFAFLFFRAMRTSISSRVYFRVSYCSGEDSVVNRQRMRLQQTPNVELAELTSVNPFLPLGLTLMRSLAMMTCFNFVM